MFTVVCPRDFILFICTVNGLLNVNDLDPIRRHLPASERPKVNMRYSSFQVRFMSLNYSQRNFVCTKWKSFVKVLVKIYSNYNTCYLLFVHICGVCWYDIHSLFILYGKKSTKLHSNMPLRKLTMHKNGFHKFRWFHSGMRVHCE